MTGVVTKRLAFCMFAAFILAIGLSYATQAQAQSKSLGGSSDLSNKTDSTIGADIGASNHACVNGDTSPAGTIVNGMKKVMNRGLMGFSCYWEPVSK